MPLDISASQPFLDIIDNPVPRYRLFKAPILPKIIQLNYHAYIEYIDEYSCVLTMIKTW